jgi:hypothetical protein
MGLTMHHTYTTPTGALLFWIGKHHRMDHSDWHYVINYLARVKLNLQTNTVSRFAPARFWQKLLTV